MTSRVDAQVLGTDDAVPVRARGYELAQSARAPCASTKRAFTPSGDLTIEYALADRASGCWLRVGRFEGDGGSVRRDRAAARSSARAPEARSRATRSSSSTAAARCSASASRAPRASPCRSRRRSIVAIASRCSRATSSAGVTRRVRRAGRARRRTTSSDFLAPLVPDGATRSRGRRASAAALGGPDARASRRPRERRRRERRATSAPRASPTRSRDATPKAAPRSSRCPSAATPTSTRCSARSRAVAAASSSRTGPAQRARGRALAVARREYGRAPSRRRGRAPRGSVATWRRRLLSAMRVGGETYVVAKIERAARPGRRHPARERRRRAVRGELPDRREGDDRRWQRVRPAALRGGAHRRSRARRERRQRAPRSSRSRRSSPCRRSSRRSSCSRARRCSRRSGSSARRPRRAGRARRSQRERRRRDDDADRRPPRQTRSPRANDLLAEKTGGATGGGGGMVARTASVRRAWPRRPNGARAAGIAAATCSSWRARREHSMRARSDGAGGAVVAAVAS